MKEYPCRSCIKTVNSCYYHFKIVGEYCEDYKPKGKEMEKQTEVKRSELFYKILNIVKKLNLEKTNKDQYDHLSATTDLEKLYLDLCKDKQNLKNLPESKECLYHKKCKYEGDQVCPLECSMFTEKEMEKQKFVFESEAEAMVFYTFARGSADNFLKQMRELNYIRKSELETLVEEWNVIAHDNKIDFSGEYLRRLKFADDVIQALKKEVEMLKSK
jgi:hypothetical protein